MRALGWGGLIALVVAGPALYPLVENGTISGSTALLRWAAVAAACGVGVALIIGLATAYGTPEAPQDDADDTEDTEDGPSALAPNQGRVTPR
jgi:hypothetical protein